MTRLLCLILLATFQANFILSQDLKSIFHIPSRRKYDELEILERSNFQEAPSSTTTTATPPPESQITAPKSYANAQVMLRFGGACGETPSVNQPYYVPVPTPIYVVPYPSPCYYNEILPKPPCCGAPVCLPNTPPLFIPAPPTLPLNPYFPPQGLVNSPPSPLNPCFLPQRLVNYLNLNSIPPNPIQPWQIAPPTSVNLNPHALPGSNSDSITSQVEVVQNGNVVDENVEESEVVTNNHPIILKTVELSDNSICSEPNKKITTNVLKNCLATYTHPKLPKPQLLLTYPVFASNQAVVTQGGFTVSESSGCYSDPKTTIIYPKQTQIQIAPIQSTVIQCLSQNNPGKILPHLFHPSSPSKCCGCSCCKYKGELNEFAVA